MKECNRKKSNRDVSRQVCARIKTVGEAETDQRLDNFLLGVLKGIPRTRIYQMIRKGEVRVNKKRARVSDRLHPGDEVRIPPYFASPENAPRTIPTSFLTLLKKRLVMETDDFLVLNKPSGYAVHGGSTIPFGIVEAMQRLYSEHPELELAHRLDRDTSGCLIFAKKKKALRMLHQLLRDGAIKKIYRTFLKGKWKAFQRDVNVPLKKSDSPETHKRLVNVSPDGKESHTTFTLIEQFSHGALVQAELHTGRTHQIRVHAAHIGHPVAMDDRYGDVEFNRSMRDLGLKRLFLHAYSIEFILPDKHEKIQVISPLDPELMHVLHQLKT